MSCAWLCGRFNASSASGQLGGENFFCGRCRTVEGNGDTAGEIALLKEPNFCKRDKSSYYQGLIDLVVDWCSDQAVGKFKQ